MKAALARTRSYLPGLAVVAAGTLAAGGIAHLTGLPFTLLALLVGLALNAFAQSPRLAPGTGFAARDLLRWGIVLVGVRITVAQMWDLGPVALVAIVVIVALVIVSGIVAARALGRDAAFGTLAGGAVAICGASAAMAFAALLGERRTNGAQLALVLVGISAMSATAMVVYPLVAHALELGDARAGFLFGAAIHDVAQSLGAGYSYSKGAGDVAAIVKLTRVALLAPALAVVALFLPRGDGGERQGVPWFVIAFFAVAAVNSFGLIPAPVAEVAQTAAAWLLAAAVLAVALRSPLRQLVDAGWRPLAVILAATVAAFALSLAAAVFLID